jgi:hypothetical protein
MHGHSTHGRTGSNGRTTAAGMGTPPEGVLAGETVRPESEPDEYDEALIEEVEGLLKARGEPYAGMNSSELRKKTLDVLHEHGVSL